MSDTQTLEHRLTSLEKEQETQSKRLGTIEVEIKDIVKLLSERPTWITTALITILTTVTSSLIVYVSMHH